MYLCILIISKLDCSFCRQLSLESPRAEPRPKPKVDIFGKKEKQAEFDEEDRRQPSARDRRRFPDTKTTQGQQGRQAQGQQGRQVQGRQTPTGESYLFS